MMEELSYYVNEVMNQQNVNERSSVMTTVARSTVAGVLGLWTVWGSLALMVHKPLGAATYPVMAVMAAAFGVGLTRKWRRAHWVLTLGLLAVTAWLVLMQPSNQRAWQDDVAKQLDYEQQGDIVTVHNVRDFQWVSEFNYTPSWEVRRYDLSKLETLDLVISIWDNDDIAHTLLSFGFSDGQRVAFSVEIRKEIGESFSSVGGFFRQYEMTVIAADEKDIIYTRSNARGERVYLYPLIYDRADMRQLFLSYLKLAERLRKQPDWYNTLTANCTTEIFELVKEIDPVPVDYRILLSGRLPEYLYELGAIDNRVSFDTWHKAAFINDRVAADRAQMDMAAAMSSAQFSQQIRQGLDIDTLLNTSK